MNPDLRNKIFDIGSDADFNETALEIFRGQSEENETYRSFITGLGSPRKPENVNQIPFLPIELFKNHKITTGDDSAAIIFESSGTTGAGTSRHYVTDTALYEKSIHGSFSVFYGDPSDYIIAALLPSYAGRPNSSLIYMVNRLIERSMNSKSGFYDNNPQMMLKMLKEAGDDNKRIFLIGVSFALLDMAEKYSPDLSGAIIVETGGMKGRRKEITREELHSILRRAFNAERIHSEYGMTELLSQAWSKGDGIFKCPPWMKVLIRDPQDPLAVSGEPGNSGGINVIDLANVNSCSFIATSDLGRLHEDGSFEVLGRMDNSDIRGCNLLID